MYLILPCLSLGDGFSIIFPCVSHPWTTWQTMRWPSMIPSSCSHPVLTLPLSVGKTCDLPLTNRIWQRDELSLPGLHCILWDSLLLAGLTRNSPRWLEGISGHVGKAHKGLYEWWGPLVTEGSLKLLANKNLGPSVQKHKGKWFCHQPEQAWRQNLPQLSFQMRSQPDRYLNCTLWDSEKITQLSRPTDTVRW